MELRLLLRTIFAIFIILSLPVYSGCIDDFTDALYEYKFQKHKISPVDGTPILTTSKYLKSMEQNTRWKRFIDEVKLKRSELAPTLNQKRNTYNAEKQLDPNLRDVPTGYRRMKDGSIRQAGHSIEEAFEKFNPGMDYDFVTEGPQKVVITPKNKVPGKTYVEIVYDISGNYFRMQKGIYRQGAEALEFISNGQRYIDWSGEIMKTTGAEIKNNKQLLRTRMDQSHFNAIP